MRVIGGESSEAAAPSINGVDLPDVNPLESNAERAIDGALRCLARHGFAKTTLDDIARESGMSRATLYRAFPGGKDGLFSAVLTREIGRFFDDLEMLVCDLAHPEDLLTVGFAEALGFIRAHVSMGTVPAAEPQRLLPTVAFAADDPAFFLIKTFVATYLEPHFADAEAFDHFCEILVRLVLSFAQQPASWLDPDDEPAVRRFVRNHLTPALDRPSGGTSSGHPPTGPSARTEGTTP